MVETELGEEEEALDLVVLTTEKLIVKNGSCNCEVGGLTVLVNFCGVIF